MGLPTESQPQQQPSISNTTPSSKPPSINDLPPAAIDLATRLFQSARDGKTSELAQYVSAGIPVNMTNQKGDTLLMLAAYYGHDDTVQMLIEKGADVNAENDRGQSPIAGAVFKGWDGVVRVLKEAGADLVGGQPSAVDTARMFKRGDYLELFGVGVEES